MNFSNDADSHSGSFLDPLIWSSLGNKNTALQTAQQTTSFMLQEQPRLREGGSVICSLLQLEAKPRLEPVYAILSQLR